MIDETSIHISQSALTLTHNAGEQTLQIHILLNEMMLRKFHKPTKINLIFKTKREKKALSEAEITHYSISACNNK